MDEFYYSKRFGITNKSVSLVVLAVVAVFLRFWRIAALTEFLGDQGRTGIIIWHAWANKVLPLVGPPVLTGQYLGPFFYYFIGAPFILSGFNPLVPALYTAAIGVISVFLLFYLGEKLYGFWIGIAIAALYAVSPYIVSSDRTLWEPTMVPFFVLFYLVCIYKIIEERRITWFFPMGIVVGALVQLHYPNILFVALSGLFLIFLLITRRKSESMQHILVWSLAGIVGFLAILSPFLYYEIQHNWQDIKGIILVLLAPTEPVERTAPIVQKFVDLSHLVFYNVIPLSSPWLEIVVLILFGIVIWRRKFFGLFLSIWFLVGIIAMSLYHGIVFNHYLNFLLPVPFLLLGLTISSFHRHAPRFFWMACFIVLFIMQLRNTDIFMRAHHDVDRTNAITAEVLSMTGKNPFSFTLISSYSFSDLHYRFFFLKHGLTPLPILSSFYKRLFLICEKTPCPSHEELERKEEVSVLCYEEHCNGEYPSIHLQSWQFLSAKDIADGRIYEYQKKTLGLD